MKYFPNKAIKTFIKPYQELPSGVIVLFIAEIINRFGGFVHVFLTLYLTQYLGFSEGKTSLFVSFVSVSTLLGALIGGKIGDRRKRKLSILFLQILSILTVGLCGIIPDSTSIAYLLILFTFCNGAIRPISTALLTDITPAKQRATAFTLLYLGINIGVAIGPMVAGFLFVNHREWIFWGDGLTTLLAMILIFTLVKEPEESKAETILEEHVDGSSFKALLKNPILLSFFLIQIGLAMIYGQVNFSLPLYFTELFSLDSAKIFGFIMSFNAIVVVISSPLITHCFRKMSYIHRIVIGALFYGLGFGILAFPIPHLGWIFISTLFWTLGEVFIAVSSGVFRASLTPANHRSRFNGYFLALKGFGMALSPLIGGQLLIRGGFSALWAFMGVFGLVLVFALSQLGQNPQARSLKQEG